MDDRLAQWKDASTDQIVAETDRLILKLAEQHKEIADQQKQIAALKFVNAYCDSLEHRHQPGFGALPGMRRSISLATWT